MPDGIDPAMNRMQTSPLNPVVDRSPADAAIEQLVPRDHAMLSARHRSDVPVDQFRTEVDPLWRR
jgi:hypothetical protein